MSADAHRRAEMLMAQADRLRSTFSSDEKDEAVHLYREAAEYEAKAYQLIPEERLKTRGIIAVSAVSLYWKAGALAEVIQHAHLYLTQSDLPSFARRAERESIVAAALPLFISLP